MTKYKPVGKKSQGANLIIFSLKGLISLGKWVKDHKSQFTDRKTALHHTPVCGTSLMLWQEKCTGKEQRNSLFGYEIGKDQKV